MTTTRHSRLIIIGSGPAGYSAAVYAARANRSPLLITGVEQGGQLMTTTEVDNWPGDVHGLQGPELMERMRRHAERFSTQIVNDHVQSVDLSTRPFRIKGDTHHYTCDALIIATGAAAKYMGLPSEEKFRGRGVSACATCDGFFFRGQKVAVVGRRQHRGRRGAVPVAHRASTSLSYTGATSCVPKKSCRIASSAKSRAGKMSVIWNHTVDEVLGNQQGVTGTRLRSAARRRAIASSKSPACSSPSDTRRTPASSPASSTCARATSRSKAALDGDATATSVPGVFAAGDVADHVYRQAITSAGAGLYGGARCRQLSRGVGYGETLLTAAPPSRVHNSIDELRPRGNGMPWEEIATRSCVTNSWRPSSTRTVLVPAPAGIPTYIALYDSQGLAAATPAFTQEPLLRRVRV